MYEPYDKDAATVEDRIAWALCQIIDDDAPMRWTRYRFAARCIAKNSEVMADLRMLAGAAAPVPAKAKREPWLCLLCKRDSPGPHGLLDDGKTPCPEGKAKP